MRTLTLSYIDSNQRLIRSVLKLNEDQLDQLFEIAENMEKQNDSEISGN